MIAALSLWCSIGLGLATRLEARGNDSSSALWSARLVLDKSRGSLLAAHRDFFAAGAEVATTASYQASFDGLAGIGLDPDAAADVMRRCVELATQGKG